MGHRVANNSVKEKTIHMVISNNRLEKLNLFVFRTVEHACPYKV